MTDVSVIILVGQEKIHIGRCLEKLKPLEAADVFVVESQPDDGTHDIAVSMGAKTVFHKYPGNQAEQFNWAVDNLPIKTKWVLRLDADEYLYPETTEEIKRELENASDDVTAFSMLRRCTFGGKLIKHGGKVVLIRLFRFGHGRSEVSEMDEHIVTEGGRTVMLHGLFVDDNLNGFEAWKRKHLNYAEREARSAVNPDKVTQMKRGKQLYYKFPRYVRAIVFWGMRYVAKLGFLDGAAGWRWNWWQGLWYRWKVDQEIGRLRGESRSRESKSRVEVISRS